LTGLPVSNCSLLDEATAAAEAMNMLWNGASKKKNTFLVSENAHPQTIAVIQTRAKYVGIKVIVQNEKDFDVKSADVFGILLQYPDTYGTISDYRQLTESAHSNDVRVVVTSDLLALTLLTPPGEWGADVVCGSAQRFGVPLGYGGPHAAFMSTTEANKRRIPGRIIGVSRDSRGQPALRMAMQTREQHIRRDKATSNICTAQALLANTAAAYAIYHGPEGLKHIASKVHAAARVFASAVQSMGVTVASQDFFDTVHIRVNGNADKFHAQAEKQKMNLRKIDASNLSVSFDETIDEKSLDAIIGVFAAVTGKSSPAASQLIAQLKSTTGFNSMFARESSYLTHPIFSMYHCETEMLRYLYKLQSKDLSLATAMIPLGSCTMKLNATSEMIPITWPKVNNIHPFTPESQVPGYVEMLRNLQTYLAEITGFHTVSLQPNAGSQGEYAGLLAIAGYHASRGDEHRNICLIPVSAHGTNPASAVMAGMKVVVVNCDANGEIDMKDLEAKAIQHAANLSCVMITYPSTHGVFEENIKDLISLIHSHGGQVYMDGANMNAQVGLCSPGAMGADVCHLNLHKTFCIPHGGGGPGMGPIGVAQHLAPFIPSHPMQLSFESQKAIGPVAATPFSSASILPISYMYIRMMGGDGLELATKTAILNANYMAARLSSHYKILFQGKNGRCAHEFIIDLREFKSSCGVTEEDIAKRLMDYNFHAPTMSWPVVGTLMVEPTESESLYELDRFCDAMIAIRGEIKAIESGKADATKNVLKGAPHTHDMLINDKWDRPYSREQAAYPLAYLKANKFWPTVGRLDNVFGDKNVVCTCPPLTDYQ